jgi:serine/threonine-protein kinase HipA
MSTIIHTPSEQDTALDLYQNDFESEYYGTYGHYGKIDFIELAKKLDIVEVRYRRIINEFIANESKVYAFIKNSSLSNKALDAYTINFKEKINRLY